MSNAIQLATTEIRQMIKDTCTRCGGCGNTGHRRCGGVCFRCGGNGYTLSEAVFTVAAVEPAPAAPVAPVVLPDLSGDDWLLTLFSAS
jgi:hypothetical protein